jgi:polar amino acid transport system substrate-binding protein
MEDRRIHVIASRLRTIGVLAATVIVAGACTSSAATSAPSAKIVATAPANQLITAGTLTICSDLPYPPQEYYDADGTTPIGSDIDIAREIAARMGLTLTVKPTVFDTIIPALTGGSCDIIVSAQTITATREEQVDMIPYFEAGQSFVVLKGNPSNLNTLDDLCGKAIAAETGTVEADHANPDGTGDYKVEEGLSQQCVAKGLPAITVKLFDKDSDALLAMQSGTVVAHFTDEPVAGYEVKNGNGAFEMIPALTLEHAPEGISVPKNHTELRDAVKAVLKSMIDDGTYLTILTKWGVESGKLSTPLT